MKLAHFIAAIAFIISAFLCGNGYAQGVETGATWGFWCSIVSGGLFAIIGLIVSLVGLAGGAAAGAVGGNELGGTAGGVAGALVGALGGVGFVLICFVWGAVPIILAIFGYSALKAWGVSDLQDQALLIKACVLLGISLFMTFFLSGGSKKSSS